MHIYTVEEITEADFGCEETGRDKLMAMLKLREDTSSEERYVEVSEEILARQKISEGQKVCFTGAGNILKYIRVAAAVITDKTDGKDMIFATAGVTANIITPTSICPWTASRAKSQAAGLYLRKPRRQGGLVRMNLIRSSGCRRILKWWKR